MSVMKYKNYAARIEYDAEDRVFIGHIAGIKDIIGFHGNTVDELENAFHEVVDDYLEACGKLGQEPNKPYSGKLMLRVQPELHAAVATSAQISGKSINQWATDILSKASQM